MNIFRKLWIIFNFVVLIKQDKLLNILSILKKSTEIFAYLLTALYKVYMSLQVMI